jgi:hypothetical protein
VKRIHLLARIGLARRICIIAAILIFSGLAAMSFAMDPYWTISESADDPSFTMGASSGGPDTLYIWYWPCFSESPMSSAEFGLEGTLTPLALIPAPGFLNAGSMTSPMFVAAGCPESVVLVASILIQHDFPGFLCFGPSINGKNETIDCSENPAIFPNHYVGYASEGYSCYFGQCLDSVEPESWGSIKSLYR